MGLNEWGEGCRVLRLCHPSRLDMITSLFDRGAVGLYRKRARDAIQVKRRRNLKVGVAATLVIYRLC